MNAKATADSTQLFHAHAGNSLYSRRPDALSPEATRAMEFTVASIRHEIVILLPSQCKSKFTVCQEALHLRRLARERAIVNIAPYFSVTLIWVTSFTGR